MIKLGKNSLHLKNSHSRGRGRVFYWQSRKYILVRLFFAFFSHNLFNTSSKARFVGFSDFHKRLRYGGSFGGENIAGISAGSAD